MTHVADPFRARTSDSHLSYSYFGASLASITARWRARCSVRHDGAGRAHDIAVIVPSGHIAQGIGACLALILTITTIQESGVLRVLTDALAK